MFPFRKLKFTDISTLPKQVANTITPLRVVQVTSQQDIHIEFQRAARNLSQSPANMNSYNEISGQ